MAYAPLIDKPKQTITTEQDRLGLIAEIAGLNLPFTCQISQGVKRTNKQNSLQHLWESQLAKQSANMTAEDWRGYLKLHYGVPVLRECSEFFKAGYDAVIKPKTYEEKREMMIEPHNFPVTRLMTKEQHKLFMDRAYVDLTSKGFVLSEPPWRKFGGI